jgi:hypothetical protein
MIWVLAMSLLSLQAVQPAEALPEGITIGEDQPPQAVHSRIEEGEFPDQRLRYRLAYTRTNRFHAFRVTVNNRHYLAEIPKGAFPNLRVEEMDLYPSGFEPLDSSLVITIEYGDPVECFSNVSPREALTLAFYAIPEIRRRSYDTCDGEDIVIDDPAMRIREISDDPAMRIREIRQPGR